MSLEKKLDEFAIKLINKATLDTTSLIEAVDAFKAATAYYAVKQKRRSKNNDEEDAAEGFTFTGDVVNGGNKTIPARRGS